MVAMADAPARTLREYRDDLHMTQREFAEYLGVPVPTLRTWEQGLWQPRRATLRAIAEKLGVDWRAISFPKTH